ncbi:MAG: UvrD-helicase domain-containing protein [Betaproteobacteria bacterium]|nr:UvrD-helicase domain-containing protein [Betaproteobacteria bacterium]
MSAKIRFISAGAGSGKTHRLTQILGEELASNRARPRGVIATTFTRKAAAELRERVRAHLIGEGSVARAHEMGQARIGTVNAVCGELLERFAFEAGMPTELRVLEDDSAKGAPRTGDGCSARGTAPLELLSLAGRLGLADKSFGSDEIPWRSDLRSLVAQARSNGIDQAALRTFGDKNADSLLAHFGKPTKEDLDAKLAVALPAAIQELVKAQSGRKNTGDYLALLLKAERDHLSRDLAWSVWAKLADEDTGPEKALFAHAEAVQAAASAIAQHPRLHRDIRRYLQLMFELAADTLATYAAIKKEIGGIDFVDQEQQLLQVLDLPSVKEVIEEELDLLMVDEFQDTSPIQLALFTRLAECARHVVWVGDVKQAIYGFRGSDSELMSAVIDSLPKAGVVPEVLSRSWRSRPSLVQFVNAVFGDTFPGLDRKLVELEPQRKDYEGAPAVIDWLVEGKNQELQVTGIAAGVAELVAEGTLVCDKGSDTPRPARYADIAVLARSNATVLSIAAALTERGVPCSTSQPGLCGKAEVVLALACLRRLVDEYDTLATAEIVSLADCAEPEAWITERLAWLEKGLPPHEWKVVAQEGIRRPPDPRHARSAARASQRSLPEGGCGGGDCPVRSRHAGVAVAAGRRPRAPAPCEPGPPAGAGIGI